MRYIRAVPRYINAITQREDISNKMKLGVFKIINFLVLASSIFSIAIEASPGLDLLTNLMDPSHFYFDKRSSFKPIKQPMPDMTILSRILGQSKSSH